MAFRLSGTIPGSSTIEPYELTRAQLEEAYHSCPAELIAALEHAAANIRDYNEKLLSRTMEWTSPDGAGGLYRRAEPGGHRPRARLPYPSSVLMVPSHRCRGGGEIVRCPRI